MKNQNLQILIFVIFFFGLSTAQVKEAEIIQTKNKILNKQSAELFNQISKEDSLVFEAFNQCDTLNYRKHFKDDLEFYHDLGGLTIGIENEMKSIREMCSRGNNIRRELVDGSMEVYPLKNYGAVEIGVHRFYHRNKGQSEKLSGEYKFIHIWQFADGMWKISRIISYGHDVMNND
ncbi:nuclear transport factor 2 family protein [Chryseobacterium soli]|uniref:nuclear transport factor 2 family protein n=1 Tax=Chryseobacterium soli TaxID=445961 RepID=UPI002953AFC7|nr:nuclear transport factor 2 family protein [Chryseobacterium soli]MDV7698687.1 nuclear transport factor 2 family protein [Chryseobacterium soli]